MFARIRQWRNAFYRGPVDLGITLRRRRGYQSPTLTAGLWGYAFVARHFTYGGRVLFLMLGFILPLGMISLSMPIHLLAFAILALFIVNILIGFVLRPRLQLSRELPARVPADTEVRVGYELRNLSAWPCLDLRLDSLPWPKEFHWCPGAAFVTHLGGGTTARTYALLKAGRRGAVVVPALRADSAFPFHLWRWGHTSAAGPSTVMVHPKFTPLISLPLPAQGKLQAGDNGWASAAGLSHEFVGCRAFRTGDSTRRIHWRSWARVGYPVVKEFRDYFQVQVVLVLDHYRPRRSPWRLKAPADPVLEAVIALSAAIGHYLAREKATIHLLTANGNGDSPGAQAGTDDLTSLLDRLACLQPEHANRFGGMAGALLRVPGDPAFAWVVLSAWDEARRDFLEWLGRRGIPCQAVLVTGAGGAPAGLPPEVRTVPAAEVLAGNVKAL